LNDKLVDELLKLESNLHKRDVRSSARAVSELLADEFVEFGSSGRIFNKSAIIDALAAESGDLQVFVDDFAVRELAPNLALVTYVVAKPSGQPAAMVRTSLRSSIWQMRDGRWQMIFHQGTRIAQS
jgi:hypothetical protein